MPRASALAFFAALVSLSGCATAPVAADRFAVVALTSGEHLPCVTFKRLVEQGERIDIVLVDHQQVLGARLGTRIAECGPGEEAGHAYRLEVDRPFDQVHGSVAVRGGVPSSISFRQCAGSESLHLTAWADGRRIWHGYYYLGYDVEADCSPEEVDEAAGDP